MTDKNAVNYDALLEAGAINFEQCVFRVQKRRRLGVHDPEGAWGFCNGQLWIPKPEEDAEGDLMGTRRCPAAVWTRAFERAHIVKLVQRCLQGKQVPHDVRDVVDNPKLDMFTEYCWHLEHERNGRSNYTKDFRPYHGWAKEFPLAIREAVRNDWSRIVTSVERHTGKLHFDV